MSEIATEHTSKDTRDRPQAANNACIRTIMELHTPFLGLKETQFRVVVQQFEHALFRTSRALRTNDRADPLTSNVDQKVLI